MFSRKERGESVGFEVDFKNIKLGTGHLMGILGRNRWEYWDNELGIVRLEWCFREK